MSITTPIWRKPLFLYYWVPPILWGLAVLCMSGDLGSGKNTLDILKWFFSWFVTLTPAQLNMINYYMRETGHFLAYGFMFFLWFRAFYAHMDYGPRRSLFFSLGVCLFLSSIDEGRQLFFPSRGASVWDVLLDMSGSIFSALITFAVWISRDYIAPSPTTPFWRRPRLLSYWLPPVFWCLAMLVMAMGAVPVRSTMGPLKWFVSWFAMVDSFQLKILDLYLWKTGRVLAYGILYVLWFRAFQRHAAASPGGAFFLSFGLCILLVGIGIGQQGLEKVWASGIWETLQGLFGACLAALITFAVMTPRYLVVPRSMRSGPWTSREPCRGGEPKPLAIGTSFWRKPHLLSYWLPPIGWSLAILAVSGGLVSVAGTLGPPLKWLVSWFAMVDSYEFKIMNLYLWKIGQVLAYGTLYVLWFRAFRGHADASPGRTLILGLGLCLVLLIMDIGYQALKGAQGELIQEILLGLSGSSLAGLITFAVWHPRFQARRHAMITEQQTAGPK